MRLSSALVLPLLLVCLSVLFPSTAAQCGVNVNVSAIDFDDSNAFSFPGGANLLQLSPLPTPATVQATGAVVPSIGVLVSSATALGDSVTGNGSVRLALYLNTTGTLTLLPGSATAQFIVLTTSTTPYVVEMSLSPAAVLPTESGTVFVAVWTADGNTAFFAAGGSSTSTQTSSYTYTATGVFPATVTIGLNPAGQFDFPLQVQYEAAGICSSSSSTAAVAVSSSSSSSSSAAPSSSSSSAAASSSSSSSSPSPSSSSSSSSPAPSSSSSSSSSPAVSSSAVSSSVASSSSSSAAVSSSSSTPVSSSAAVSSSASSSSSSLPHNSRTGTPATGGSVTNTTTESSSVQSVSSSSAAVSAASSSSSASLFSSSASLSSSSSSGVPLPSTPLTVSFVQAECGFPSAITAVEGFQVSVYGSMDFATLEDVVASLLNLDLTAVDLCTVSQPNTPTLLLVLIGVPVQAAQLAAALNSSVLTGLGFELTESPTVLALATSVGVVGDPQFSGFRGQSYQVHGVDGAVYALISSPLLHVNARFVFLESGKCPVVDGASDVNCWSHPGSYLGEIGMMVSSGSESDEHRLLVRAGSHTHGFAQVSVDGRAVEVGSTVQPAKDVSIERVSTHQLAVSTAQFSFVLDNSDRFINQQVRLNVPLSHLTRDDVHGLLGQTHRRTGSSGIKVVEGDVDDYVVNEGHVFGTDFVYNRYNKEQ